MSPSQKRRRRGFEYSPLQSDSFRLLEIIPGQSLSADIHCRLRHYQLKSAPPYEALSYTWGDEKSTCRMSLDGLPFYIRPNLRDVLRLLRQSRKTRIIWIDAICIDQQNTDEKNAQVPLMGSIYTRARRVVAWLGEETFDSGMALDSISLLTDVAILDHESLWLLCLGNDEFLRRTMSLVSLFSRPWWRRMWIVQEVALGPDVLVLCGPRRTRWSKFHYFIKAWMNKEGVPHRMLNVDQKAAVRTLGMLISGFAEALMGLRQSHQIISAPKSLELPRLLWSFKHQLVTNPRDKIYGLLGVLSNHGVSVDYDKSVEEIYSSFFSSLLEEDKGLDWFRWMTGECHEPEKLYLPSWVPDFGSRSLIPISSFLPYQNLGEKQRVFLAAGRDRSRSSSTIQFGDDPRTLILRGHFFDVVSQCGRIYPCLDDVVLGGRTTGSILSHWKRLAMKTSFETYHSRIARENAFWRTILTDRQIEGLHFQENAGWYPAQRLPAEIHHVPPKNAKEEEELLKAMGNRKLCLNGRRFCITKKGHFCLLPPTASKEDLICVLLGGEVPYVLRRIDNQVQDSFTMVGECYVHGIMDGEVVAEILNDEVEFRLQ